MMKTPIHRIPGLRLGERPPDMVVNCEYLISSSGQNPGFPLTRHSTYQPPEQDNVNTSGAGCWKW